jgi:hypothetical protein
MRNAYKIFVGKLKGKRPLGKHRCRFKNNTKMYLGEMWFKGVGCINLAQNRDGVGSCTGAAKGVDKVGKAQGLAPVGASHLYLYVSELPFLLILLP